MALTKELPKIPSEFIEPYLQRMLSIELECLEYNPTEERLEKAKQNLKGVESFVSRFCGIHANIATGNVYYSFYELTLEQVKDIISEANKIKYPEKVNYPES